jgi:hypothetical protein
MLRKFMIAATCARERPADLACPVIEDPLGDLLREG